MIVDFENSIKSYIGDDLVWVDFEVTADELFKNGEQGVWLDPSDLSTMFQDIAGTVPVTKNGDPVALIKDKSGNNNHASQTTAASRPVYKTDGSVHWLEFDGIDDHLIVTNLANATGDNPRAIVAAVDCKEPTGNISHIVHSGRSVANSSYGMCSRISYINRLGNHYWNSSFNSQLVSVNIGREVFSINKDKGFAEYSRYSTNQKVKETKVTTTAAGQYYLFSRVHSTVNPYELGKGSLFGLFIVHKYIDPLALIKINMFLADKAGI